MGAFFVFSVVGAKRADDLKSLNGLSRQNPALAAVLLLAMFSLAGVPPLAGFTGKFLLFAAAAGSGHYVLLFFAALNSVASLYYYMIVIKEAYIVEPEVERPALEIPIGTRWALLALVLMLVILGLWPGLSTYVFQASAGM
jgi:NADH-quinone oxidoreductase subunit N